MVRARRSDAKDNDDAIRAAASRLLGAGRHPTMSEIAAEAGVSRQTLYAHYRSCDQLYRELATALTGAATAIMSEPLPADPADAIRAWTARAWALLTAHPALLNPVLTDAFTTPGADPVDAHEPVTGGLRRALAARHPRTPPRDDELSTDWTVAAVIALGHAAAQQVATGRMDLQRAGQAFTVSVVRLCLLS